MLLRACLAAASRHQASARRSIPPKREADYAIVADKAVGFAGGDEHCSHFGVNARSDQLGQRIAGRRQSMLVIKTAVTAAVAALRADSRNPSASH